MASEYKPTREVRLAVVMYGGISLAIYMSGIAQELLALVRATAPDRRTGLVRTQLRGGDRPGGVRETFEPGPLLAETELKAAQRVYRTLGRLCDPTVDDFGALAEEVAARGEAAPIRTRFVVDVLSGSSAGGLNAVFLGKALANDTSLDGLKDVWLRKGDIVKLINTDTCTDVEPQMPPPSLLSGPRMYLNILEALDAMEPKDDSPLPSSLVDKLDLFITATDLEGLVVPIALADKAVEEKRHRANFHFTYRASEDRVENDFRKQDDPFLAFAARCSSAFPLAFEPMALEDAFPVIRAQPSHRDREYCDERTHEWERFYREYVPRPDAYMPPFAGIAFADGGYLDNKPFSYAIDATFRRHAERTVDRRLVYIEPAPERVGPRRGGKPDAFENLLAAASTLPRYETIREDLARVMQRNAQIERLSRVLWKRGRQGGFSRGDAKSWRDGQIGSVPSGVPGGDGIAYRAYEELKVSAATDDLARVVCRAFRLAEASSEESAVRMLVSAWRTSPSGDPTWGYGWWERGFLWDFDAGYHIRRLQYLRTRIDESYRAPGCDKPDEPAFRDELLEVRRALRDSYEPLVDLLESERTPAGLGVSDPADDAALREAVSIVVGRDPVRMRDRIPATVSRGWESSERGMRARAQYLLEADEVREVIGRVGASLREEFRGVLMQTGDVVSWDLSGEPAEERGRRAARRQLQKMFDEFEGSDFLAFPVTYGTDLGEGVPVKVHRFSPEDADALAAARPHDWKLRGTSFGAFGGFFDEAWRRNDILWGRLDGAELLVSMALPGTEMKPERERLIAEAQEAIVLDELGPPPHGMTWRDHLHDYLLTVREDPDPRTMARAAARSAAVAGDMLQGIAQKGGSSGKPWARLAKAGRVAVAAVEAAVPQTMDSLVFRHGMQLSLLVSAAVLVVALLAHESTLANLSAVMLAVLATLVLLNGWLRLYMRERKLIPDILRTTPPAFALALFLGLVANVPRALGSTSRALGLASASSWVGLAALASAGMTIAANVWIARLVSGVGRKEADADAGGQDALPSDTWRMIRLAAARDWEGVCAVVGPAGCRARRQMRQAVLADYVLIGAYALLSVLAGVWLVLHGHQGGILVAGFGALAAMLDFVENRRLVALLEYVPPVRPGPRLAYTRTIATVKWAMLAAAAVAFGLSAAGALSL